MKVGDPARAYASGKLATAPGLLGDHALPAISDSSDIHEHTNFLPAAKWRESIACAMV
jgi:hypothetical protein